MQTQTLSIPAHTDQYPLAATYYPPTAPSNQKVLLINSAMGVKRAFYADFAQYLAGLGFGVYTFDYRGMGDSAPKRLRGFQASLQDWGKKDVAGMIGYIQTQHPEQALQVVCHSVGGQIVGLAHNNSLITKLVLLASQSGNWRFWDKGRAKVWVLWHLLIPTLSPLFGYFPAQKLGLFANLPKEVAQEWARWGRHPDYFRGYIGSEIENYQRVQCPLLAYSFEDDFFAPYKAASWLTRQYSNTQATHHHIHPKDWETSAIGHFAFFKPMFKNPLWVEISDFLS